MQKEKVINRSYRNRRIGDFLKELHITEGRSTGFPKIYRALKKNGSPLPVFETDEYNQYFLATIKIHEAFLDEDAYLKRIGKERDVDAENVPENVPNNAIDILTERQRVIYNILKSNVPNNVPKDISDIVVETAESLARKLSVSTKTVKRELKLMKELGIIKREGGNFGGHWEIIK